MTKTILPIYLNKVKKMNVRWSFCSVYNEPGIYAVVSINVIIFIIHYYQRTPEYGQNTWAGGLSIHLLSHAFCGGLSGKGHLVPAPWTFRSTPYIHPWKQGGRSCGDDS